MTVAMLKIGIFIMLLYFAMVLCRDGAKRKTSMLSLYSTIEKIFENLRPVTLCIGRIIKRSQHAGAYSFGFFLLLPFYAFANLVILRP